MDKYYAVKVEGNENRIFTKWDECKEFIQGKVVKYKAFLSLEEAKAFLSDKDIYEEEIDRLNKLGAVVAFTDGSFSDEVKRFSYGAVLITPEKIKFELSGSADGQELLSSRQVAGETEGVLAALDAAYRFGYDYVEIFYDYIGLMNWATGVWKPVSEVSIRYLEGLQKYRGRIDFRFSKVKGHSNNKYNEIVDKIAKDALFNGVEKSIDSYFVSVKIRKSLSDISMILGKNNIRTVVLRDDLLVIEFGEEIVRIKAIDGKYVYNRTDGLISKSLNDLL